MEAQQRMRTWRVQSPCQEGFYEVISPQKSDCRAVYIFRLNLSAGKSHTICSGALEMNGAVIAGAAQVEGCGLHDTLSKLDSFYIPAQSELRVTAAEDLILYIGGAAYDGIGEAFTRHFDASLPLGDLHQIHGSGVFEREVFFTLEPQRPASRLLGGLTWGGNGAWTSWPPHQHENDLEEVYCYFDMDAPHMGLHISYLRSGEEDQAVVHPVQSGTMVLAPRGYHPTVAAPGTRNAYFWVLAAFEHKSRRYDLSVNDPRMNDLK